MHKWASCRSSPVRALAQTHRYQSDVCNSMAFGVDKRGQLIIHRYGVCTVILSGLPTATPGLTHFLKLDGNQQQYTTGMPDSHQVNCSSCFALRSLLVYLNCAAQYHIIKFGSREIDLDHKRCEITWNCTTTCLLWAQRSFLATSIRIAKVG